MRLIHKQSEKIEELQEFADKIKSSPTFQTMEKEDAAKLTRKRILLVEKLPELKAEALKIAKNHAVDELILKLDAVEIERKSLVQSLSQAKGSQRQEQAGVQAEIQNKTEFLLRTCDPKIDETIDFFREKLDFLRQDGRISTQRFGVKSRDFFKNKINSKISSNYESVGSAMKYCQKAIKTLELWKLEPELDLARLEKLKTEIPSVDTFQETDCERPIPGIREAIG